MKPPKDPFENVRVAMLEKDAKSGRVYPTLRQPDSVSAPVSITATQGSFPGPTPASTDAQRTQSHETKPISTTAPLPCLAPMATPFAQRDYVDSTRRVEGKFGGNHTMIRRDKWDELSERFRDDPVGYKKAVKKLRYKDNKDRRTQAERQVVAAAAVAAETSQSQAAWAAQDENLE